MPAKYIILRQSGRVCTVTFYDSDAQHFETLFTGKRWAARRFLKQMRACGYANIPAFCEKEGRNGNAGTCVEIPFGKL